MSISRFVQHLRAHYYVIKKAIEEQFLVIVTKSISRCDAQKVLAKIMFSKICTIDLQILRNERELKFTILDYESVCQVLKVNKDVRDLNVNKMIILNSNNLLNDHDKLNHIKKDVFQKYVKFN
jgi:NADPH:quinone reductase-like Zn-dependent oxidoreductase